MKQVLREEGGGRRGTLEVEEELFGTRRIIEEMRKKGNE